MKKTAVFIFLALITFSNICFSDVIHVPADQATIQDGIDAAVNGDTVIVAPGTYVENITLYGKAITLQSSHGPNVTVIDGNSDGSVVTCAHGEGEDTLLDGFTLTNGTGTRNPLGPIIDNYEGGGIWASSSTPTIMNNIITGNTATGATGWGGGIYCNGEAPLTIKDNIITGNCTLSGGGGIYCVSSTSVTIVDNIISDNSCLSLGGGIFLSKVSGIVEGNTISDNESENGGGLKLHEMSDMFIINNSVVGNTAYFFGGGIAVNLGSSLCVANNLIHDNQCTFGRGGGIYAAGSPMMLVNNMIYANSAEDGGGLGYVGDVAWTMHIINNTLVANTATRWGDGAYFHGAAVDMVNTIVWGNQGTGTEIYLDPYLSPATLSISYSDLEGGSASVHVTPDCILDWGVGMIDADPLFADAISGDFHLTWNSPCRDAGDDSVVNESNDFEGDPRIAWTGTVDLGADEFYNHLYCIGDFIPSGSIVGNFVGSPNTWPLGLFVGSGVLDPPIQHGWGDFYLESPWLLFPLVPIPGDGILKIPATLPSTAAPYDIPMQALIGWELSNLFVVEVR